MKKAEFNGRNGRRMNGRVEIVNGGKTDTASAVSRAIQELFDGNCGMTASLSMGLSRIVRGAIAEIHNRGYNASTVAKELAHSTIWATREFGLDGLKAAESVAATAVETTLQLEGDLAGVVTGLMDGAIEGSKNLAMTEEEAALAVAIGALEAARPVGHDAVIEVKQIVSQSVGRTRPASSQPSQPVHQQPLGTCEMRVSR